MASHQIECILRGTSEPVGEITFESHKPYELQEGLWETANVELRN